MPQHAGKFPLPLSHWIQLWPAQWRLLRCQRVLHQSQPLQIRLLQHWRGLPLWMSTWILPCGTRVRERDGAGQSCRCVFLVYWQLCFGSRHCVTGLGFTSSSVGDDQGGDVDDNSLSPEACYECKINGYPKKGRRRRSTNSTQEYSAENMQVTYMQSRLQQPLKGLIT